MVGTLKAAALRPLPAVPGASDFPAPPWATSVPAGRRPKSPPPAGPPAAGRPGRRSGLGTLPEVPGEDEDSGRGPMAGNYVQAVVSAKQPPAPRVVTIAGPGTRPYRAKTLTLGYRNTGEVSWARHFSDDAKRWFAGAGKQLRGHEIRGDVLDMLKYEFRMALWHEYGQLPIGVWSHGLEI